jgi:hypothetical protein
MHEEVHEGDVRLKHFVVESIDLKSPAFAVSTGVSCAVLFCPILA